MMMRRSKKRQHQGLLPQAAERYEISLGLACLFAYERGLLLTGPLKAICIIDQDMTL